MSIDLALDIETIGPPWADLSPERQAYLLARCRDDGEREQLPARLALVPGIRQVAAIGIWSVQQDRGIALVNGRDGDEAAILRAFWRNLPAKPFRLITFRGRSFDGPTLMVRSAVHGIECERDLVGYRYSIDAHCDLADCLSFMGAERENYTLAHWCECLGNPSPKEGGVTGADIGRLHAEGDYETIATYVAGDARATARLFQRLVPMLRQFRGGPSD